MNTYSQVLAEGGGVQVYYPILENETIATAKRAEDVLRAITGWKGDVTAHVKQQRGWLPFYNSKGGG